MDIFTASCYAFSIFNLLILTLIIWSRKGNGYRNAIFGFYILLFAISLSFNLGVITNLIPIRYYFLCLFPSLLLGPTAYVFCLLFMQTVRQKKRLFFLHYLSSIALAVVLSLFTIAAQQQLLDNTSFFLKGHGIPDLFRDIIVLYIGSYHFYCFYISKNQLKNNIEYSEGVKKQIYWVHAFFKKMLIIFALFLTFHVIRYLILGHTQVGSSVISPVVLSLSYILILYNSLSYMPVFSVYKESDDSEEKYNSLKGKKPVPVLEKEQTDLIEYKLRQAFEKEKLFKDHNLNLHSLSDYLELSPKVLSQFIHQCYDIHFNDFINKYRVEESMRMMQDPSLNNLKLEAIAEAAGFSSRASFFSIFKKATGNTPAVFRKEHSVL